MMGGFGPLFGMLYGLLALLSIAAMACGIWYFVTGARYFQSRLSERPGRREFQAELLAKMDQMVDVLKVK